MVHEVKGCGDCPLAHYEDEWGTFCENPSRSREAEAANPIDWWKARADRATTYAPSWCPLRVEPLIIKFGGEG